MNGKVDCVAGLFSGLWCIAVIQEQASPIYLRQHKSAQPSTANVVESIAPPISSHIPTACSCCVPGKGGARGGKAGFATLSAFPLVPAHAKMVPLKGKVPTSQASPPERASPAFQASPRKGHHLRFMHPPGKGKHPPEGDQASVSSWNCGIGVTGG